MSSAFTIRFVLNDADLEVVLDPAPAEGAPGNDRAGSAGREVCAGGLSVLDFLRRRRRFTGTKEGCKEGDCGACTVLVGELAGDDVRYRPVTSCMMPVAELGGRHLVTVEGLDVGQPESVRVNTVQRRIVEAGASQCGFCTPGIVVSLLGRLMDGDAPAADAEALPAEVDRALSGHLCRCTGYRSLRSAAAEAYGDLEGAQGVEALVAAGELPEHFLGVPDRLRALRREQRLPQAPVEIRTDRPVVAGGTDLYVQRSEELPVEEVTSLPAWLPERRELRGVRRGEDGRLRVGALTTFEDLVESREMRRAVPRIGEFMHLVASWQIRNRSTVGGNLVNASPIGDVTILMLALGAEAALESADGTRRLPLRELYLGYKELALEPGELLVELRLDVDGAGDVVDFEKVSKRRTLDIASVNTAMCIRLGRDGMVERCGLAAGGVAPVPLFLEATCDAITGRRLDRETVALALRTAQDEISPISDVRGSSRYKRLLVRNLLVAHLARARGGLREAA